MIKFFLRLFLLKFIFLLNDGKYTPSKLSFNANLKLLDKKNFLPYFLQIFLILIISCSLYLVS